MNKEEMDEQIDAFYKKLEHLMISSGSDKTMIRNEIKRIKEIGDIPNLVKRVTIEDLSELLGLNKFTVRTWLCRSEFAEFYKRDNYFGRRKISYVYNIQFRKLLCDILLQKGYRDSASRLFIKGSKKSLACLC